VFLSYGEYKSRVFKHDILQKIQLLFNWHNNKKHCIQRNIKTDFMSSYREFVDIGYRSIGEYWFNNNRSYECFEPHWNPQNCRAMGNVFIPKNSPSCTQDLRDYIDETFESAEKLYYKMDYTVGMQIVDNQTLFIRPQNICLLNTELHRNGKALYAVIVQNTFKSKQRWKIIDYKKINEAFMTADELVAKYNIFRMDLPKGSKATHRNFEALKQRIEVTKQLIRGTNWSHIRIVQSKQNLGKLGLNNGHFNKRKHHKMNKRNKQNEDKNGNGIGVLKISERRFKALALKSLQTVKELTPIAHFKFRKNKYHLEKLLPVYIPEHNKYVAISFWYNPLSERGRTQASGVCLDLTDMKNKANLVEDVPNDSWLNKANDTMTINNLTIGQFDSDSNKNNKNNKKQRNNKQSPKMQQPQPPKIEQQKICYVPSKVQNQQTPVLSPQTMAPQQLTNNILNNYNLNYLQCQNVSIPISLQSVPQLIHASSVSSIQSNVPSLLSSSSIPSIISSQQSISTNISYSSVPNNINTNYYQQQAHYFANFLPQKTVNYNNTSSVPISYNYLYANTQQ